jgi:hypothetical protein
MYDPIQGGWGFVLDSKVPHIDVSGADAAEISAFVAALAKPVDLVTL